MKSAQQNLERAPRVYLIGMAGVGKSTLAQIVARHLRWICIDTDACVERNSCLSVSEIFALFGEQEFRRREWQCLRQTTKYRDIVVACGGGAPCFNHAMEMMLASGTVIYLKANITTLIGRLGEQVQSRPLLAGSDVLLSERLSILLDAREQVYSQAHYVIETDGLSAEDVVSQILSLTEIPHMGLGK